MLLTNSVGACCRRLLRESTPRKRGRPWSRRRRYAASCRIEVRLQFVRKSGPPKEPAFSNALLGVSYCRTILRARRPPATSRAPAPSANNDAPPVLGSEPPAAAEAAEAEAPPPPPPP